MIIFGTRGRTKDNGEAVPAVCPRCHNRTFFHFVSRARWFTLFFVPVIPFSSKHFIVCPVCNFAVALDDEGRERAGRMVGLTGQWRAGTLTDESYRTSVEAYVQGQMRGDVQALQPPGTPSLVAPPSIPPPPSTRAPATPAGSDDTTPNDIGT